MPVIVYEKLTNGALRWISGTKPGEVVPPPPPPNIGPVAQYTFTASNLLASFDATSSSDPDGTVDRYNWNFGDGTFGSGAITSHTYASAGTYQVLLEVIDNLGERGTITKPVSVVAANVGPTASFTASVTNLTVSVNATSSSDPDGTISAYSWNWGDNTALGTGDTTSHTYAAAGTYTITLTVTDNNGSSTTTTRSVSTTTGNAAPIAAFTASANNLTVNVDGATSSDADGSIVEMRWNWGDGTPDTVVTGTAPVTTFVMDETQPDASNTGLGIWGPKTGLTTITGNYTISTNTTLVENLDVSGRIVVGNGVTVGTIQNCRVRGTNVSTDTRLIDTTGAANQVHIRGCEIGGGIPQGVIYGDGIGPRNYKAERNNIHHVIDGFRVHMGGVVSSSPLNVEIMGNYVHDGRMVSPDPGHSDNVTHSDCVELEGGNGVKIHGNTFAAYRSTDGTSTNMTIYGGKNTTSCIMMANPGTTNVEIYSNWLYGGLFQINAGDDQALINSGIIRNNRHFNDPYHAGWYIGRDSRMTNLIVGSGTQANRILNADGTLGAEIVAKNG